MTVYNLKSQKSGRPVANQFVIDSENKITFQSYQTEIAWVTKGERFLCVTPDWEYSKTTMKYFYQFLQTQVGLNIHRATEFRKFMKENLHGTAFGDGTKFFIINL